MAGLPPSHRVPVFQGLIPHSDSPSRHSPLSSSSGSTTHAFLVTCGLLSLMSPLYSLRLYLLRYSVSSLEAADIIVSPQAPTYRSGYLIISFPLIDLVMPRGLTSLAWPTYPELTFFGLIHVSSPFILSSQQPPVPVSSLIRTPAKTSHATSSAQIFSSFFMFG